MSVDLRPVVVILYKLLVSSATAVDIIRVETNLIYGGNALFYCEFVKICQISRKILDKFETFRKFHDLNE